MRKVKTSLIFLFLFLAFNACQNNDEIVSPETNSGQNQTLEKITMTEINLNNPGANTCIQLVAGRNMVVGDVCVDYIESTHKLKVTYSMTEPGWTITKTHVAAVIHPFFFPRTWTLQPRLSHFPYKGNHDHLISVQYMIDIPNYYNNVYLAIHAKVEGITSSGDPVLEPNLPATDVMTPTWMPSGSDYIVESDFNNLGVYQGWSIDNSRFLSSGEQRVIKYLSSYSDEIPECTSFIENSDNLDLVNWIINNKEPNWDKMTIQAAIWTLLNPSGSLSNLNDPNDPRYWGDDPVLRENIISLATANGEGFEPGCGDKVLILAYSSENDSCSVLFNIVGFEYPVECGSGQTIVKHAWAFPFENSHPVPDMSKRFSWIGWARYVKYSIH